VFVLGTWSRIGRQQGCMAVTVENSVLNIRA
jgi:hypothetical protein